MKKILINFAHPAKSRSRINTALLEGVKSLDNVTVNDLYAEYPDFLIDVKREQMLCEQHDILVFQHPFYWYSSPAIVKEWFDLVLEHGWAYGSHGKALVGKYAFQAISGGGDASTYRKDGFNEHTIAEFTSPFKATAKLCNLRALPPFTVLGVHRGLPKDAVESAVADYRRCLIALRDETFDIEGLQHAEFLNSNLDALIKG